MILQALYEYYQRKASDPDSNIAPEGWEWKEIPFLIVIDQNGNFLRIEDTREGEGNKKRAKTFCVIQSEKRAGKVIKAGLLWDTIEYVLGANPRGRDDIEQRHAAFIDRINKLPDKITKKQPIAALISFLSNKPLEQIIKQSTHSAIWKEIVETNPFITFRVEDWPGSTVFDSLQNMSFSNNGDNTNNNKCLVTGEFDSIARLHPPIKGVRGGNVIGGSLVSFNLSSFCSFGKNQNFNAPISNSAAFAYTTALNELLGKDSKNKFYIGDTSAVFWGVQNKGNYRLEDDFASIFGQPPKDDPDKGVRAVRSLFQAVGSGKLPEKDNSEFYVLGLAPNAARISVRFFKTGSVHDFAQMILQHFRDLEITRGPHDREYPTLNQLLISTVFDYKSENIPPNLAAKVVESVLDGTPYPNTLLQLCMRRIRAERHVTYTRAAILKAYLNRFQRFYRTNTQEVTVSLNKENHEASYLIGRLFATLEKIQKEAQPNINATITDRYYGAASSNPVTVFPQLLKLKNHHLAKLNPGRKIQMEKLLGEIMNGINTFPAHLTLNDQANFAIGYYHQQQDFYRKNEETIKEEGVTE